MLVFYKSNGSSISIVYLSLCSIKAKYKTIIGVSRVRRSNRATHGEDYDLKIKVQVEEKLAS